MAALTSEVKQELTAVEPARPSVAIAELATLIRFAGSITEMQGSIVLEIDVDSAEIAQRCQKILLEEFKTPSDVVAVNASGVRRTHRYVVRICRGTKTLLRRTGLIGPGGKPVMGLPPRVVGGGMSESAAIWRGAFLARGSLTEPGRSSALEVSAPCLEAALAVVGAARRMNIPAKQRETRGVYRVQLRDGDAIAAILTKMGAHDAVLTWEDRRTKREVRGTANRLANFDDANLRRSARAAVAAGARVERAFEILGEEMPDHLRQAGVLRLENKQASLEELGKMADPPLTKDAVAGRIRRLLAMADRKAEERGIPDTKAALTADMLDL